MEEYFTPRQTDKLDNSRQYQGEPIIVATYRFGCLCCHLDADHAFYRYEITNHKGSRCPYQNILCQEGYCDECEIEKSLYNRKIDHLKK
jgi:hypothetical protein